MWLLAGNPEQIVEIDDLKELIEAFLAETDEVLIEIEQQLIVLEQQATEQDVSLDALEPLLRPLHTFKGNAGMLGLNAVASLIHTIEELIKQKIVADSDLIRTLFALLDDLKRGLDDIRDGAEDAPALNEWTAFLQALVDDRKSKGATKKMAQAAAPANFGFADDLEALEAQLNTEKAGKNSKTKSESASGADTDVVAIQQESTLRVSTDKLDQLQREVGELILAFNAAADYVLNEVAVGSSKSELREATDRIDRLATRVRRVQTQTTKIRLLGLSSILRRVPRIARDAAEKTGKKVQVIVDGEGTEADKSVVDQLADVIVHLVRNAVDHGIETATDRAAAGKTDTGILIVRAAGKGDHIQIEVEDDGGGIDIAQVKKTAVESGIVSADEAASADTETALRLLFASGFSTRAEATELSGRGVGLDVVDRTVRSLGGTVRIESTRFEGTKFILSVPISTAVAELLHVDVFGYALSVPMRRIIETQRIDPDHLISPGGTRRYRWRDTLIPLVDLSNFLILPDGEFDLSEAVSGDTEKLPYVLILEHGAMSLCVPVSGFQGKSQAVLHPLGDPVLNDGPFSGATVMGNGFVSLILDPDRLYDFVRQYDTLQ